MWSDWLVFCDCCSQSVCPLMEKGKRLVETSWGDRLTQEEAGSCFDGWGCIPSLFFDWDQTMVEVIKIMVTSFKRSPACTATLSAPDSAGGPCQPTPLLETPGHSQASLGQRLVGSLLLSPGSWCTQGFVCALHESVSPICKFCNQNPLASKVKLSGSSRSLCQIPVCHKSVVSPRTFLTVWELLWYNCSVLNLSVCGKLSIEKN